MQYEEDGGGQGPPPPHRHHPKPKQHQFSGVQLRYQNYQQPLTALSTPKYHEPSVPLREKIWQTACRVYLTPNSKPAAMDAAYTRRFDWNHVIGVDVMLHDQPVCPICLETFIKVPRVTYCGHVFCWSCILRYIQHERMKEEFSLKCPICSDIMLINELRPARIQKVTQLDEGGKGRFVLALKKRRSVLVRCVAALDQECHVLQRIQYATPDVIWDFYYPQFCGLYGVQLGLEHGVERAVSSEAVAELQEQLQLVKKGLSKLREELEVVNLDEADLSREFEEEMAREMAAAPNASLTYWIEQVTQKIRCSVNLDSWRNELEAEQRVESEREEDDGEADAPPDDDDDDDDDDVPTSPRSVRTATNPEVRDAFKAIDEQILYQLWDGQLAFLSPACVKMIFHNAGCEIKNLPSVLPLLPLLVAVQIPVTPASRARVPYLDHLPDGISATIWEVDLTRYLKPPMLREYREDLRLLRRRHFKERRRKELTHQKYEQLQRKRSEELAERRSTSQGYYKPVSTVQQSTDRKSTEDFPVLQSPTVPAVERPVSAWRSRTPINDFPELGRESSSSSGINRR